MTIESTTETASSIVAFGTRDDGQRVVLKVIHESCDEWNSGQVLRAFGGGGIVPVYESVGGALLMPRLDPGTPLAQLVPQGRDVEATDIICHVITRMSGAAGPVDVPTVADWGAAFDRFIASGDLRIEADLVAEAQRVFNELCASQRAPRLLHGDLQHYNILADHEAGWTAIDPKGVFGEVEYEIGAALRNPVLRPDLFATSAIVAARVARYASNLALSQERLLGWAFAQAVLSAIWSIEDGEPIDGDAPVVVLAQAIQTLL